MTAPSTFTTPTEEEALFIVSEEEASQRLDVLLTKRFPLFSRTYFQKLITAELVLLNGKRVKKRELPQSGDEIEVAFIVNESPSLAPEPIPLDILYEDEECLIVNKPVGMVVHPAPGHPNHTFVNALLYHCQTLENQDPLRPGIVHRLDKDTSGALIAAKTERMHQALVELFSTRQIEKEYLAVCVGNPGERTIDAPIGRHPSRRKEMAICHEKGRSAITHCVPLAVKGPFSFVRLLPKTGRTHQLRVHLKTLGTPILGDIVYGSSYWNEKQQTNRQLLHAYRLSFQHPFTHEKVEVKAPLPQDMENHRKLFEIIL